MRSLNLAFVFLALTAASFGQASSAQAPAQSAPGRGPMAAVHQQHMDALKADIEKMRAKLDEMKANLAKVKDPAAKQQIQLDADLWATIVGHMEQMQKMMADRPAMGMMGGGMAGMHHHGMGGCCQGMAGMHHDEMGGCCGCCAGMQGGMKCMQGPKPGTTDEPVPPADKQ
jgi:hypothetical protein